MGVASGWSLITSGCGFAACDDFEKELPFEPIL